jgi:hypothetical protein
MRDPHSGISHLAPARLAEQVAQRAELVGHDAEVGPAAALLALDEAGVAEDAEMVRDGRLAQAEWFGQVADACFAVRLCLDQAQQPQPRGVGDHLERIGETLGFGSVERAGEQRWAGGGEGRDRFHHLDIDMDRCLRDTGVDIDPCLYPYLHLEER